jgi:putative hydrolase of the HAD superfamily
MRAHARAVLFDLDDTLYRERRFALSGFRHVAQLVAASCGLDAAQAFRLLAVSLRRNRRGSALQALCISAGHPIDSVPALVDVMRGHMPAIHLPLASVHALEALRAGWRLGIVTNGLPDVQRRKVAALGLEPLVDTVVYACEHGSGLGKPDPEPFLVAADRLGVEPARCVFVGDDLCRDVAGARAVGMRTIRVARRSRLHDAEGSPIDADAVVSALDRVARLAPALIRERRSRCA